MKNKIFKMRRISLALLLAGIGMAPASYAVDLVAIEGQWSPDGGTTQIPMWGFASDIGQDCNSMPTWSVGPQLTDADLVGGNLTVNLRNCLSEGVSIVIPGQPATFSPQIITDVSGRKRITAFTYEAPADGVTKTLYTWTGVKPGTYLYQSGSHPAKQVQMGLYGALTIGTYTGTIGDVNLLYSEIDPALHNPPAAATPLTYKPRYYLVNGSNSQPVISAGDTNQPTVLRFLNAGLDFHVPALNSGYMSLVAEDGNAYPFSKQQYSVNLAAGKTIDALWQPASAGDHVIYDRRGNGMVATLTVSAGVGAPVATADSYAVDEDNSLVTIAGDLLFPGVLDNDPGPGTLTANLSSSSSTGSITLNADGSFTYAPYPDFNGTDSFSYRANDGALDSNIASVTITVNPVNDMPVAGDNAYDAVEGTTLSVAAPGVLGNDSDVDGDSLNAAVVIEPVNGSLTLNTDGSFSYTPYAFAPATDSFTYQACDAEPLCAVATVSLNIIALPNSAPVAVEEAATVTRNSAGVFIDLTGNDTDADGNLKDGFGNVTNGDAASGTITITTGSTTSRGGTVSIVTNGVNYTPKRNFRGSDTFSYTVTDTDGAVSNEVIVRVSVVR